MLMQIFSFIANWVVGRIFCIQFLEELSLNSLNFLGESLDLKMQVNFVFLLGSCSRTCEEFSPDGLHFCGVSAIPNSGILGRMEYGKPRRNISSSNS